MIKNAFIASVLILITIFMLFSSGCWDRQELNSMSLVVGLAFDQSDKANLVQLTAQLVDVSAAGFTEQGGGSNEPFWNITAEGLTVFDAIRKCSDISPRRLFFAHNQAIIFSEEVARDGINKYLDLIIRGVEFRDTIWVVVSGGKAENVLSTPSRLQKIPAMNLSQLIQDRSATSQTSGVDLHEFTQRVMSSTAAPVASFVSIVENESEKDVLLSGTAVFDKDLKMVGRLDATETRGLLWVLGEIKSGVIVVKSPECEQSTTGLEIVRASSKIEPQIKDGHLKIIVKINELGVIGEDTCQENLLSSSVWNSLERRQSEAIRREILLSLNKARELNADIFGFGDAVQRKYPQEWKELEKNWGDIFPGLAVEVEVKSRICRSGMILDAIK